MSVSKFIATPSHETLPAGADVVIIGGGPAGTAALWALDRAEPGLRIVLIERSERLGAGSTLASLENFRSCWPMVCNARQMARSVEIFENADDYLGEGAAQSVALRKRGYLFCGFNEAHARALHADVERLHAIGLTHIEYLDADEVRYRFGWLGERVIAAKYDPIAGWLDSNALIHKFVQNAANASIIFGIADAQIVVEGGRVCGVRTPFGTIAAPAVVIAAGAHARAVGKTADVDLPILVRPRQSFTTGWRHDAFPADGPMVIGAAPHPHVRPEAASGAIFGWEYTWHCKSYCASHGSNAAHDALREPVTPPDALKDPRFPSLTLALFARQFGHSDGEGFADGRYLRGLHHNIGYYVYRDERAAYTIGDDGRQHPYDSERAIIDRHPEVDGLFVSIAHGGHGIMTAPSAGEILACHVLGRPLPDPAFADYRFDAHWVEYDEGVL